MLNVTVEVNLAEFKNKNRQISETAFKNALRRAVNDTAFGLVYELQNKTFSSFKMIKPNTMKMWVDKAQNVHDLSAIVRYKTYNVNSNNAERNPGRYLLPNAVSGVFRAHEGYERALWFIGALRNDEYAMPTEAMMKGGKMNGSLLISMLNYLRQHRGDSYRSNSSLRSFTRKVKASLSLSAVILLSSHLVFTCAWIHRGRER